MTVLKPPPDRDLDVVCVGNAIVDVLAPADEDFLARHGMVKGAMQLIDAEVAHRLYAAMPPAVEASGGSAANTAAGVAALGGSARFVGRVADDQLGEVFAHDIRNAGVVFDAAPARGHAAQAGTARCLILVTDDAQRTMNTYLGVSAHIGPDDVGGVDLVTAKVLYCEGYLWDEPTAKAALRHAMDHARQVSTPVAFTLSDAFCVDRHRVEFLDLVADHVDILFANESEICSLYEVDDLDEAAERVAGHVGIACLTRSERGSVILASDGSRVEVAAAATDVVDTTGAGDLYAAGFLSRWAVGADLAECGRVASLVAGEVISHMGARPETDLRRLAGL
ncbi:MAG: adenosine kinase [Acidimicrobiales bacterium]|nr:adenosine kinase [Acidimicrobiales bacterium]